MTPTERSIHARIRLIGALFIVAFLLIVARAGYLQLVMAADLTARGNQQHQRVIKLTPERGGIYDRNGEELAISLEVKSLYANPREIKNGAKDARLLSSLLGISQTKLRKKLAEKKSFVWIKRKLKPAVAQQVAALDLPGLHFVREHKRYYPRGQVASQVVGFTGLDPKGLEGLELLYDADLQGESGLLISGRDARGRGLATAEQNVHGGVPGDNLTLTIDRTLQYVAEKELARQVKVSRAAGGTVVMIEPASGRILAMASQPSYNPNAIQSYCTADWRNRAVSDSFEPGSIFKPILLASVLEEEVFRPSDRIYCEKGYFAVGGKVIRDHKRYGWLNLTGILKHSSNIGFAKLGAELGRERYSRYIHDFGFGAKTGVDLPGEVEGLVRNPDHWFKIDLATISFGQGISVTALQMASAMGVIANGGLLMKPYVVEKIVDGTGTQVYHRQPEVVRRVVSATTAKRVRNMMITVTEAGGTGVKAAISGYRVAGKTGTAQKVDPMTGGYSVDKRIASFIGMVPAENPALVVLVTIDEPRTHEYGGLVAAPAFKRIAAESMRYLDIPPTEVVARHKLPVQTQKLKIKHVKRAKTLVDSSKGKRMPDFRGMSYRQVLTAMRRNGLNVKLSGSGKVVDQSPRAGKTIHYGAQIWVRFGA